MSVSLKHVYRKLYQAFGPQHWWPADSPFEVIVGAVLTQNTSWKNVERALDRLRETGLLSATALYELPQEELAEAIRPAGYFRIKARRLKNLLEFIFTRYNGSLPAASRLGSYIPQVQR